MLFYDPAKAAIVAKGTESFFYTKHTLNLKKVEKQPLTIYILL